MKGKIFAVVILIFLVGMIIPTYSSSEDGITPTRESPFDGGSGINTDPYQISTIEQLQAVNMFNSMSFVLTQDIDAYDTINWNNGSGFFPICPDTHINYGHQGESYSGDFDGQGYSIIGLYINRTDHDNDLSSNWMGLFGSNSGRISNLILDDGYIHGYSNFGGIAGQNFGTIENCRFNGTIKGNSRIGGIAGIENSLSTETGIINCTSSGVIIANYLAGGIVGTCGSVIGCRSDCNIETYSDAGGIAGRLGSSSIQDCIFSGDIIAESSGGGIVGYISTSGSFDLRNCKVENSTISGGLQLGGIAGHIFSNQKMEVSDLSFTGKIQGKHTIGGIFGAAWRPLDAYNLHAEGEIYGIEDNIGGIVGQISYSTSVFSVMSFKGFIMGRIGVGGIAGWNMGTIEDAVVQGTVIGDGSTGLICGWNDRGKITDCMSNGTVVGSSQVGGVCGTNDGDISNCSFEGNVSGVEYVGGVAGNNNGGLDSNYGLGMVTGDIMVGGMVGFNSYNYRISQCYYSGTILGNEMVGGFAGKNHGRIFDSYGFVDFSGEEQTGGFVGNNTNLIVRCYIVSDDESGSKHPFAGENIGTILSCYFDNETYQNRNYYCFGNQSGMVGRSWSNMTERTPYIEWNFNNTWHIIDGYSYPFLLWQEGDGRLEIINDDVLSVEEDQNYSVPYKAVDPLHNDMRIKWELETNASWLSMDERTGLVSGTPTNNETGSYFFLLIATDARGYYVTRSFNLTVIPVNDLPEIRIEDLSDAVEDQYYEFDLILFDEDNVLEELEVKIRTNATWLDFDAINNTLFGLPQNQDVGSYWVDITVKDPLGENVSINLSFNVINANDPPVISGNWMDTAFEGKDYFSSFNVTDIDPTRDWIELNMNTTATWLSFNPLTRILSGTPSKDDIGIHWINITADDQKGGLDWILFSIEVLIKYNITIGPFLFTDGSPITGNDVMFRNDLSYLCEETNENGFLKLCGIFPGTYNGTIYYDNQEYIYNITVMKDGTLAQKLPDIVKVEKEDTYLQDYLWMIILVIIFLAVMAFVGSFIFVKSGRIRMFRFRSKRKLDEDELRKGLEELTSDVHVEVGKGMEDLYGPSFASASGSAAISSSLEPPALGSEIGGDDLFDDFDLPDEGIEDPSQIEE